MATLSFLPERLNREPVVFRGLTVSELFCALLSGLVAGLLLGVLPTMALRQWPCIPAGGVTGAAFSVLYGGRWLMRLKRGRPDAWLYQMLESRLARYGLGHTRLVQHSAVWCIRRGQRQ
ncbi:TIGR03750 family conjugal transfer protein [Klebsiella pneumoniae]